MNGVASPGSERIGERASTYNLENDVVLPGLADRREHFHDIRVVETTQRLGVAIETLDELVVFQDQIGFQALHGDAGMFGGPAPRNTSPILP